MQLLNFSWKDSMWIRLINNCSGSYSGNLQQIVWPFCCHLNRISFICTFLSNPHSNIVVWVNHHQTKGFYLLGNFIYSKLPVSLMYSIFFQYLLVRLLSLFSELLIKENKSYAMNYDLLFIFFLVIEKQLLVSFF